MSYSTKECDIEFLVVRSLDNDGESKWKLEKLRQWEKRTHNLLDNEVSVYARTISVSSNLCQHLTDFVELFFDPNNHIIAIKPVQKATRHTYKVHTTSKYKGRRELTKDFAPYSMLNQLKVKRLRYHAEWVPKNGFIVFEYQTKEG